MSESISLREWARENEVWKPEKWRIFLEKDLVPFYKQAYTLNSLYKFLKSEDICGKASLADISETFRDKIKVAIYGGVSSDEDINLSFAKFMYDYFGVCVENASSFEESIKLYERYGDSVKIGIKADSWISNIPISGLVNYLEELIRKFCEKLNIKFSDLGVHYYFSPYVEGVKPITLLPQAGEKAEELLSLINRFKQKALDLSIGVGPFTTFVFYIRCIPLSVLMEFLECDIDSVTRLAYFLGLRGYSMIDQEEVALPTKSPDKVILFPSEYLARPAKIAEKILQLQGYLVRIEPTVAQKYESMLREAINQIHINFEPWKAYEPIFFILKEVLNKRDWINLKIENGKIVEFDYKELHSKIWLKDFLIKISPAICAGIVSIGISISRVTLKFHPLAKEWIDKVIRNEGKT